MIRILLIRHGKTDLLGRVLYGRMPDIHLNSEGQIEARMLARELNARYEISEVVSSPLDRAIETAQPIADFQGLGIVTDEGINELDFGSWMGKSFAELAQSDDWNQYNRLRATSNPPGGESMTDVQGRAWRTLQRIAERYRDAEEATVAVVTHGDVVRALLLLLLGMSIDHIHRLEVAPASMSEVLLDGGEPVVRSVNQMSKNEPTPAQGE